jgi:ketosteroid isomerase-like protein
MGTKRFVCFLPGIFALLSCLKSFGQGDSLQRQINEQVWKPFISAFNADNDEGFQAVHSREVTRIEQDNARILTFDQYFRKIPDSVKASWGAWKRNLELRFIQRIAGNGRAFEVGYYKTTSTNSKTGESRTGYGKFHVLLRKENGIWKILMDADAHEMTDEVAFLTGKPME